MSKASLAWGWGWGGRASCSRALLPFCSVSHMEDRLREMVCSQIAYYWEIFVWVDKEV